MLKKLLYGLMLCFLYPLAWLPWRVCYVLADISYFLFYHLLGYRKAVVYTNLARSFPEKSYGEIKTIAKQYYHFFADLFFENIKTLGTSSQHIKKIVTVENLEPVKQYLQQGKSAVLVLGHFGNWEYLNSLALHIPTKIAYKPQNGVFDRVMKRIRTHYSGEDIIIPMQQISRYMLTHRDTQLLYVFIADQSPAPTSKAKVHFLHQNSLFFEGAEKMATRLNLPVVYVEVLRLTRGRYKLVFTPVCEAPDSVPEFEITRRFAALLEQSINRNPQYWLWSHKRWKHKVDENLSS